MFNSTSCAITHEITVQNNKK